MNAKEKAEEMVLKFLRIDNNTPEWFNTHIAKQCALIAVDEIIINMNDLEENGKLKEGFGKFQIWLEVKTEINNI